MLEIRERAECACWPSVRKFSTTSRVPDVRRCRISLWRKACSMQPQVERLRDSTTES